MAEKKPIRLNIVVGNLTAEDRRRMVAGFERAGREAGARFVQAFDRARPPGTKFVPSSRFGSGFDFRRLGREAADAARGVDRVNRSVLSVRNGFLTLASSIYVIRSFGSAINSLLIRPLANLSRAFIEATEHRRRFVNSLSGVAGIARARDIERLLTRAARNTPASLADVRQSALALTAIPALASRMSTGSPAQASREAMRFADLARRMGQIDPIQGTSGAITALREGAESDLVSIRRRFGWSAEMIARAAGAETSDLRGNPALTFKGIEKIVDVLLPREAASRANQLISVRVGKLRDAMQDALADIGDSGVFDDTVARLERVGMKLFDYFDSPAWRSQARRISGDLDRIIGRVGSAIDRLFRKLTGTQADTSTVAGVATAIGDGIERLARLSDNLPGIFDRVGGLFHELGSKLNQFIDSIVFLADAARDPAAYVKGVGSRSLTPGPMNGQAVGGQDVNVRMRDILARAGIDTGKLGTRYYNPATDSTHVWDDARRSGAGMVSAGASTFMQFMRGAVGSQSMVEELSFDSLDPRQRLYAEGIYAQLRETGNVPPEASPTSPPPLAVKTPRWAGSPTLARMPTLFASSLMLRGRRCLPMSWSFSETRTANRWGLSTRPLPTDANDWRSSITRSLPSSAPVFSSLKTRVFSLADRLPRLRIGSDLTQNRIKIGSRNRSL